MGAKGQETGHNLSYTSLSTAIHSVLLSANWKDILKVIVGTLAP